METLFLKSSLAGDVWFLMAAGGALIGRFDSPGAARVWCEENGYRMRIIS